MCQIDRKAVLQLAGGEKKERRKKKKTERAVLLMTGRVDCKDHSHSEGGQGREGEASRGTARRRRELVRRCKHTGQAAAANLPAVSQFDAVV